MKLKLDREIVLNCLMFESLGAFLIASVEIIQTCRSKPSMGFLVAGLCIRDLASKGLFKPQCEGCFKGA